MKMRDDETQELGFDGKRCHLTVQLLETEGGGQSTGALPTEMELEETSGTSQNSKKKSAKSKILAKMAGSGLKEQTAADFVTLSRLRWEATEATK